MPSGFPLLREDSPVSYGKRMVAIFESMFGVTENAVVKSIFVEVDEIPNPS